MQRSLKNKPVKTPTEMLLWEFFLYTLEKLPNTY